MDESKSGFAPPMRDRLTFQGDIPPDAKASLERLLSSEAINRAPRIRLLLKFLIDALMEGRANAVNERAIGESVFRRPTGYNPGEDNIVRVSMRHLRERLDEYYRTEGRGEKYMLNIPRGKYIPILTRLENGQAADSSMRAESNNVASVSLPTPPIAVPSPRRLTSVFSTILVFAILITPALIAWQFSDSRDVSAMRRTAGLLSLLLVNGRQTTIILTDSNLQAYRMIFRKTVSLNAYLSRSYLEMPDDVPVKPEISGAWMYVNNSTQTSLASSIIASEFEAAAYPTDLRIKHPHDLSMRDLQHGNYILLGGPWVNPWGQLFENHLNFRILPLKDRPWGSMIVNDNPISSEPAVFLPHSQGTDEVNYARIALLENFSGDGYVIMLGATSDSALEAAGKFLLNQAPLNDLFKSLKTDSTKQLPNFEAVIEVKAVQGVPEKARIVAKRLVKLE